jgi:hypothetical protein
VVVTVAEHAEYEQWPTDHPSTHCYTCADYMERRRETLLPQIVAAAERQGVAPRPLFVEFMGQAHQRHLEGEPLYVGGPTRVTDPLVGRFVALMALSAGGDDRG